MNSDAVMFLFMIQYTAKNTDEAMMEKPKCPSTLIKMLSGEG
jgi:hypothetical protein